MKFEEVHWVMHIVLVGKLPWSENWSFKELKTNRKEKTKKREKETNKIIFLLTHVNGHFLSFLFPLFLTVFLFAVFPTSTAFCHENLIPPLFNKRERHSNASLFLPSQKTTVNLQIKFIKRNSSLKVGNC